jgi:predicted flap endonuclease-1-like 5' DNA nuclease
MEEQEFRAFLKRGGRSASAASRVIALVREFEGYLEGEAGAGLDDAGVDTIEAFVDWIEKKPGTSAKGHLWALRYYYDYRSNQEMSLVAGMLREQRIERKLFPLKEFRGVDPEHVARLADVGITNVQQLLAAAQTPSARDTLSRETGASAQEILELVKLSDLARLPGVKGIRARLYYDAGVDTVEKLAIWDPEDLRAMVADFAERTGFDGIAPLPLEVKSTVTRARTLPKIVEY